MRSRGEVFVGCIEPSQDSSGAFTGFLGAALAAGLDTATAVRRGMAAGALATTLPGASPSLPDQKAGDELLAVAEGAAR
ncbi:hypothetical protein [Nonomuraea jabiensis]|uniref:Sugar/nucleoside kinase (Ribokinase family) n=1 Tax=Nonomuraea jabiensis TaxID=882448 RepID=A0A7W9G8S4_9ACTN|nr:hypothetical protein [Nonomuraea jabiensis]MBB5779325.1 sugar/nucleoside kinase (ribokinase family) [Nonomuraea jabiensis]